MNILIRQSPNHAISRFLAFALGVKGSGGSMMRNPNITGYPTTGSFVWRMQSMLGNFRTAYSGPGRPAGARALGSWKVVVVGAERTPPTEAEVLPLGDWCASEHALGIYHMVSKPCRTVIYTARTICRSFPCHCTSTANCVTTMRKEHELQAYRNCRTAGENQRPLNSETMEAKRQASTLHEAMEARKARTSTTTSNPSANGL